MSEAIIAKKAAIVDEVSEKFTAAALLITVCGCTKQSPGG